MIARRLLLIVALRSLRRALGTEAAHRFGQRHAEIRVHGALSSRRLFERSAELRVMHISDAHVSLRDDDPPRTSRMFGAFERTVDKVTGSQTSSAAEFVRLLEMACAKQVDLIALGGDIVNFPSNETVSWVLSRLRDAGCNTPFLYTAGNHDWHVEGLTRGDSQYDAQRVPALQTALRPLFERSAIPDGRLYGRTVVKDVEIVTFDNSNHQIDQEQLDFAQEHLAAAVSGKRHLPVLVLLHMPLALPGVDLEPKHVCGHRQWGAATDENWQVESRPPWPKAGNLLSTRAFIELVRANAAPAGRVVALLTGHVHRDFSVPAGRGAQRNAANHTALACDEQQQGCALRPGTKVFEAGGALGAAEALLEAEGAVQYTTLDGAEGGYRLLTIQHAPGQGPPAI